eukprot:739223_1
MAFSDSAINGSLKLALLDLPDALLLFLNNFLDFGSLLSLEKVSKELRTLCRNPHSCYQLSAHIHSKLISHLNACASIMEENADIDSEKVFNYFHSIIARFVHVKHLAFVSYPLFKSPSHIIDYLHHNLYSPIAAHSQFSAMDAIDWRRWEPPRWKTRLIDQLQPPLSFSVQTAHLTCAVHEIIPQLYDVEHLEHLDWCSDSIHSSPLTDDSLPYLLLNKNRFNLQTLHIGHYKSPSTDSHPYGHYLPVKGIYLQRNGLFFNEFNDINIKDYHQKSTQNLHTIHTLWGSTPRRDTVFFFYNICKLFYQTIRSLHISDDVLQMPEYKDIYQDMTLNQLEELCLAIQSDEDGHDVPGLPFHSGYKYFQTPNVTRLNFHFSFDESRMVKLKRKTYDFNRFCNAFGIETNRLRSFSLNISSMQDTRNHDDNDMDEETALFYSFWNVNVVCMQCMEFVESIMEGDKSTDDGFSFGVYLSEGIYYDHTIESGSDDNGVYIETGSFVPNHCQRIVEMTRSIDALWCKYPQKFNVVKLRFCCDEKTSRMATKVFDPTKYPNWIFATKTILGCGDHAFQRSSCGALEWKRVNQKYCKSPGFISECAACILPIMDNYR